MINLTGKTYEALRQGMLDQVPDTYDKRDTAPIPTAISPAAYALAGFYMTLDQVQRAGFIQTAVGADLDLLAVLGSISRDMASPAVRLGVFNADVPIGARFSTINGSNSINFTVTAPAGGAHQYQLTAETPGKVGNEYTGPILPITTIPGLTSARLTDILVPGDDTETDEELRERLIVALNERPFGGNVAAYRQAVLSMDGVGEVQVYPTWNGGGTVKCSILGSDLLPASSTLVKNVQNEIDPPAGSGLGLGLAPIGAKVTIVSPTSVSVSVSATLNLAPGYSIPKVKQGIEDAISAYLLEIRKEWGKNVSETSVQYSANVYVSRVTAAIVGVQGVSNASDVRLNGGTSDLTMEETGTVQQVPVLGEVSLT